jgi:hypothetical protein
MALGESAIHLKQIGTITWLVSNILGESCTAESCGLTNNTNKKKKQRNAKFHTLNF